MLFPLINHARKRKILIIMSLFHRVCICFLVYFSFLYAVFADDIQPEKTFSLAQQNKTMQAKEFMVVAAHPLAVEAGYDVLNNGGSAADAALAVQLVLNVVEPQSSGIGGGAFLLYWDADKKKIFTLDGREKAPQNVADGYFLDGEGKSLRFFDAVLGGKSVGVPGTLKLLHHMHQKWGTKPWQQLFNPAIKYAEKGFIISPRLHDSIQHAKQYGLAKVTASRRYFFDEDEQAKKEGTLLKNLAFSKTLKAIAQEGIDVFYNGYIGRNIVKEITQNPHSVGVMNMNDLKNYRVIERNPLCFLYREIYKICAMGPPSSGGQTVGQILKILENFDLPNMGYTAQSMHLFIEASKLAFADRAKYSADPDFIPQPYGYLDSHYLKERSKMIKKRTVIQQASAGKPPGTDFSNFTPQSQQEKAGTTHFVIIDKKGNAVSMTSTIETGFGSRLMVDGFLLNNELTDFSFTATKNGQKIANSIAGNKRPRSSMSPVIVFKDHKPFLLIGSPGGSRIISYVALSLIAILDWDMSLENALHQGHVSNRNGKVTDIEENTQSVSFIEDLQKKGHVFRTRNLNSGLHVIKIDEDYIEGSADRRREGIVLGR